MLTSTIKTNIEKKESKPFPKLMKDKNEEFVILVTKSEGTYLSGTVVKTSEKTSSYPLGRVSESWYAHSFEDWKGSVTLTQE